jgi:hypothetical protein
MTSSIVADSAPSLARFLAGSWRCAGGTPSGRVLNADVEFTTILGDRFISVRASRSAARTIHVARAMAYRHRTAAAGDGRLRQLRRSPQVFADCWGADSIVWVRDATAEQARMEMFTSKRTGLEAYWYAWHVRRAAEGPFVLGDLGDLSTQVVIHRATRLTSSHRRTSPSSGSMTSPTYVNPQLSSTRAEAPFSGRV